MVQLGGVGVRGGKRRECRRQALDFGVGGFALGSKRLDLRETILHLHLLHFERAFRHLGLGLDGFESLFERDDLLELGARVLGGFRGVFVRVRSRAKRRVQRLILLRKRLGHRRDFLLEIARLGRLLRLERRQFLGESSRLLIRGRALRAKRLHLLERVERLLFLDDERALRRGVIRLGVRERGVDDVELGAKRGDGVLAFGVGRLAIRLAFLAELTDFRAKRRLRLARLFFRGDEFRVGLLETRFEIRDARLDVFVGRPRRFEKSLEFGDASFESNLRRSRVLRGFANERERGAHLRELRLDEFQLTLERRRVRRSRDRGVLGFHLARHRGHLLAESSDLILECRLASRRRRGRFGGVGDDGFQFRRHLRKRREFRLLLAELRQRLLFARGVGRDGGGELVSRGVQIRGERGDGRFLRRRLRQARLERRDGGLQLAFPRRTRLRGVHEFRARALQLVARGGRLLLLGSKF